MVEILVDSADLEVVELVIIPSVVVVLSFRCRKRMLGELSQIELISYSSACFVEL